MKVFKLFYLEIEDIFIISHAGTLKGTLEGEINNFAIDMFQGGKTMNIGDGKHMRLITDAEQYYVNSQFQIFLEGLGDIESLITHDKALIPFAFAHMNNIRGKIFDKQPNTQRIVLHPLSQP